MVDYSIGWYALFSLIPLLWSINYILDKRDKRKNKCLECGSYCKGTQCLNCWLKDNPEVTPICKKTRD